MICFRPKLRAWHPLLGNPVSAIVHVCRLIKETIGKMCLTRPGCKFSTSITLNRFNLVRPYSAIHKAAGRAVLGFAWYNS